MMADRFTSANVHGLVQTMRDELGIPIELLNWSPGDGSGRRYGLLLDGRELGWYLGARDAWEALRMFARGVDWARQDILESA